MDKKLIIIAAAIGLGGFAGMFIFAWFTKTAPPAPVPESVSMPAPDSEQADLKFEQPQIPAGGNVSAGGIEKRNTITEKQLKGLVAEVREKIQEYDNKLKNIGLREQRLRTAQDRLKEDIEELNNLRIDLTSIVVRLKSEQDNLLKSIIEIANTEKNNLISIAAAYDKMDASSAGQILITMKQSQKSSADDAVKIIHYMSERTKAKVLASMAETEPAVSAYFCQKLKRITEKE